MTHVTELSTAPNFEAYSALYADAVEAVVQPAQRCAQVTADGTERALEAGDAEGVMVRVDPIDLGEHGAHAAHGRRCAVPATYPHSSPGTHK